MTREINNYDNTIDARDMAARIAELEEGERATAGADADRPVDGDPLEDWEADELANLRELRGQLEGVGDWPAAGILVRDAYFEEYAENELGSLGLVDPTIWDYVDWTRWAGDYRDGFTKVQFDGVDYWAR